MKLLRERSSSTESIQDGEIGGSATKVGATANTLMDNVDIDAVAIEEDTIHL